MSDFIMDDNADEEVIANAEAIAEDEEESTPDKNNHLSLDCLTAHRCYHCSRIALPLQPRGGRKQS